LTSNAGDVAATAKFPRQWVPPCRATDTPTEYPPRDVADESTLKCSASGR